MAAIGTYNTLEVVKLVDFGCYLDGQEKGEILLPTRFMPPGTQAGDQVRVFLYHDSDNRLIATTQEPYGTVGDIVALKAVAVTKQGAFLDWGLMKDLFVPVSQQQSRMYEGEQYLVLIYIDEQTGRAAATEKFAGRLSNDPLTVGEKEQVALTVWQKTDIGYKVIVNGRHTGVLHYNEVFRELQYGEKLTGFIKTVRPENKLDVSMGQPGHLRVGDEKERVLEKLRENNAYLPYHDKSAPEEIYEAFGISKKTFKMIVGALYKDRIIELMPSGIRLAEQ